jgi:hypothetical protein
VVLDAAGPFQARNEALVEAAMEKGFDVVDLNDNIAYSEKLLEREAEINARGIRVLPSCSSVSAVAACLVKRSGIDHPVGLTACIIPATRSTATAGTAASLLRSVGRPVRVWSGGRWLNRTGWTEQENFSTVGPLGSARGCLFESADALWLPRAWSSLENVSTYVDTRAPALNAILSLAARAPVVHRLVTRALPFCTRASRLLGSRVGGLAYEIKASEGEMIRYTVSASRDSYLAAVAPAVVAARSITKGCYPRQGLVPPSEQVAPRDLWHFFDAHGIEITGNE